MRNGTGRMSRSAGSPPRDRDRALAMSFRSTVSRLMEMQSKDYLEARQDPE